LQTALVLSGAIGFWLGIQTLRLFFAMVVWNVAEDQLPTRVGLVALAIWSIGLLGWIAARVGGGAQPAYRSAALLAILVVIRQVVSDEAATAVLAFASMIVWLWWLPAYVNEAARHGASRLVALAALCGIAIQVAGQLALHGLDVPYLVGPGGWLAATVIAAAFVLVTRTAAQEADCPPTGTSWGAIAVGPFLFLQLTLLANIGFIEALGGWELAIAGLVIELSLVAAALALMWLPGRVPMAAVGAVTLLCVIAVPFGGIATLAVVPAQAGLVVLLAGALSASGGRRTYLATYAGAMLFFVFTFAAYADYANRTATYVWPIAAVAVALPALRASRAARVRTVRSPIAVGVVGLAGVLLSFVPSTTTQIAVAPASGELTVFDYNIHQGFDLHGLPALPRVADVIAANNADVITLQEVNRVWDLSGAVDSYSWLKWRFGAYQSLFGPMNGVHFGNAIFSRYPITESGTVHFPIAASGIPRGFAWARIAAPAGEVLVTSTHLTPYDRGEEIRERGDQAALILAFWDAHGRARAIHAGDYNDDRQKPAVTTMVAGGFIDALAGQGLGAAMTFASSGSPFDPPSEEQLDYIFVTKDVEVLNAQILQVTTSDHRPLVARVRFR
jgi:endonuclease/exonuclease/phosphatase family metal-dependent hydrolase